MEKPEELVQFKKLELRRNHVAIGIGLVGMIAYSLVDYLITPSLWLSFLWPRIILALLGAGLMSFSMLRGRLHQAALYAFWIPALFFAAYGASRLPTVPSLFVWNTHLFLVLLLVSLVAVSPFRFNWLIFLAALASYILFFLFDARLPFVDMLVNGGLLYLCILALLPVLLSVRYRQLLRNARLGEQVTAQNDELLRSNADKDRFFSIIAHDLKGPMGSAARVLNRLLEGDSENMREELKIVGESVNRSYALLENLLLWARCQRGELTVIPVELSVIGLWEKAWQEIEPEAMRKRLVLETSIDRTHSVVVDKKMAMTMLHNLLANAVRYTPPEGRITVLSDRQGGRIVLEVRDTGVGMDAEKIGKLFKIGEKQNGYSVEGEKGSGLGLILCKEFADRNEGSVRVTSVPGQGSSFFLELPSA